MKRPQVTISSNATTDLLSFCRRAGYQRMLVVADTITHRILGQAVRDGLCQGGCDARSVVIAGAEVAADAASILDVVLSFDRRDQLLIAVGSGTITDITRFVSHRVGVPFVAVPTAPSVDGFASPGAPLIVRGVKTTAIAHPPIAIFADLDVVGRAPPPMIAAGFGDMLGKHTSVADWKLGSLVWGLPFDAGIANRSTAAVKACEEAAGDIATASRLGAQRLLEALLESGFCMLDFGSSLPASGAEHHYSHFWEMKLLQERKPAILHGAKVGVATIFVAELYERLRRISVADAEKLLAESPLPSAPDELTRIRQSYGPAAEEVAMTQMGFIGMTEQAWEALKQKIVECWDAIQDIAQTVPGPLEIAQLLRSVGGPTTMEELGLPDSYRRMAGESAHFLRNHFTVSKLLRILFPPRAGE